MNATNFRPMNLVAADVSLLHLIPREVGADSRRLLRFKDSTHPSPLLAALLLCVFALSPLGLCAATNDLSSALQTGLFEEEANRNLPAAIEAYEKVAKQFDQNRALAATAIFRLGEVNRKLGKTNEAAAFYQRILREFTDQDTLATLSRQNLAGMGVKSENALSSASGKGFAYVVQAGDTLSKIVAAYRAAGVDVSPELVLSANPGLNATRLRIGQAVFIPAEPGTAAASVADLAALHAAEAEVAALGAEVKQLQALSGEDFRRVVQQNYANPVLSKLLQDLAAAEQQAVVVSKDYGPDSPTVKNAKALIETIQKQIDTQLGGVLIGLQQKHFVAAAKMKALRERTDQSAAAQTAKSDAAAPITAVLDEEEAEIRRIQAMIQNSPDLINAPSGEVGTPLYQAASKGQLRVAAFLLDHGADVNTRAGMPGKIMSDWTPLFVAANRGHRAMVELLAARGADVNAKVRLMTGNLGGNLSGGTALHQAVEKGFQAVAEALLMNKAEINARDTSGGTPLHLAADKGHPALTAFLVSKGANVNAANEAGLTPLMFAAGGGHRDTLNNLIAAKASINAETTEGRTALSYAAENSHQDCVTALLAAKADPNVGKVNLPLHCAIKSKSAGIVEALLKAGADANRVSKGTWNVRLPNGEMPSGKEVTPLALAMNEPQLDIVKLLLGNKADPNGKRVDGLPLIFSAVNNAEMTKAFLDAGAKPNVDDGTVQQSTPLLNAGNPQVVTLLLAAKANPETRHRNLCDNNDLGMTPLLLWTSCWSHPDLAGMVEALLKGGANVNALTDQGWTPLHFAAANKKKELMELLLAHKADANARNNQGFTPLDLALGKHLASGQMALGAGTPILPPPGGRPVASKADDSVAELLRQHGGLADLPKLDRIELVRPGSFQKAIFVKGTNDWNRFTLLEALLNNYKGSAHVPRAGSPASFSDRLGRLMNRSTAEPPFPDLRRIIVVRQQAGASSKPAERITVDLLNATNGVDCAKDIALNFGDVVEIPERLHTLQEPPIGLTSDELVQIMDCRKGVVTLVYQGKKTSLPVGANPAEALIGSILAGEEARKALFSSADLSRVKVTRRDSANGKPREWIVDCSNANNAPDLWLRDGDVIEVPEKTPSIFDTDPAKARAGGTVYLTGAVRATTLKLEAGKTTSVLAAVLQIGTTDSANLKKVELQRVDPTTKQTSKTILDADVMTHGDRSNDVLLQDGDLIVVPKRKINF